MKQRAAEIQRKKLENGRDDINVFEKDGGLYRKGKHNSLELKVLSKIIFSIIAIK